MLEKQINAYLSFQIRALEILGQFCQSYIENTLKPLLSSTSETSVKIGVHLRQREYSRSVDATPFFCSQSLRDSLAQNKTPHPSFAS